MEKYLFSAQILHFDEILVVAVYNEKFHYHSDCRKQLIAFTLEVYLFATTFEGILDTVKESFEGVRILEWKDKLVGIGVDGASVNLGKKGAVLQRIFDWTLHISSTSTASHIGRTAVKWRSFMRCCR